MYGRQVLVYGNKSSGKSSLCLQIIAEAQKEGKQCAWIDSEQSYSSEWAEMLGVDTEELIFAPAQTVNDMVDVATALMKAGVDVVVVDSISALLPAIYFEKGTQDLKELQDTKQIGAEAKDMTHAVKMLNFANENTLLILISQQRNNFGQMYVSHIPTGGQAVKFFSSTVLKLWSSEAENIAIKKKVKAGSRTLEKKVGRPVNWTVEYNKTGTPYLNGKYDFYFDIEGDFVGVDRVADAVDYAESLGIIERGGAWYKYREEKFQGRPAVIENFRAESKYEKLLEDIHGA